MDEALKTRIDAMTLRELMVNWRFGKSGDPLFQGEVGDYYVSTMNKAKSCLSQADVTAISKSIGW